MGSIMYPLMLKTVKSCLQKTDISPEHVLDCLYQREQCQRCKRSRPGVRLWQRPSTERTKGRQTFPERKKIFADQSGKYQVIHS
jgi:hypothetical protein